MSPKRFFSTATTAARLLKDNSGQVAILFGLTCLPLVFLVGGAVDYAGASNLLTRLQKATDATSLKLCQLAGNPTQSEVEAVAQTNMQQYMGAAPFTIASVQYTQFPRNITLTTQAHFSTSFVGIMGPQHKLMPTGAVAGCTNQLQSYEIALVLDNTGSMARSSGGQSKMQALQQAATNFVTSVFGSETMGPATKMSLVPFAASVAVNPSTYRGASWVDTLGRSSTHWSFIQGGSAAAAAYSGYGIRSRIDVFNYLKGTVPSWDWNGCFESLAYPLNVQDGAPTPANPDSYYVPMLAPDESGDGGQYQHTDASGSTVRTENSYINDMSPYCAPTADETTRTGQACKYMQLTNYQTSNGYTPVGPNFSCTSRPLTRLTNSQSTLTTEVSAMQPNGNTDIHEGLMWGWRTLSPNSVFADGASYGKDFNNKIIVLMTDGMNTWTTNSYNPTLKSYYSAYGFLQNPDGSGPNGRLKPINANPFTNAQTRAAIDALTLEACQNARAAGVVIYTIGFSVADDPIDQAGLDLLQSCAGSSDRFYLATDGTTINTVFQKIADAIGRLRLTR